MRRLWSWLKRPWLAVLIGVLVLALLIWFGGPYLAIAERQPLDEPVERLLAILLLVIAWAAWVQVRQLRARRAGDSLVREVAKQEPARGAADDGEAGALRERFDEAVAALRASRKGTANLYDLPWYIIIGPPGSGKTTALVNSGLNFPLSQRFGREAVRGVGGTRNCDWWFTDEAIFLDTAGRYTTQDSDRDADAGGWLEFLRLLKKHRRRRPINGVLVALSLSDLMTLDEPGLAANVAAVRSRLDELNRELGICLPVYVLFTKADLVAGFAEFFADLDRDGRAQVWGTTFAAEATYSGAAAARFGEELDALVSRLYPRLLARLDDERDTRRRASAFAFPQQLAGLRDVATRFIEDTFASSRFDGQVLLRGVYLTSGTQEGTPIDRIMSAVARSFGVDAQEVARPAGHGRAFFIERLFKDVVFNESGLAGLNRRRELQKRALQVGAWAGTAALTLLGLIALSLSFERNAGYIGEVQAAMAELPEQGARHSASVSQALADALPRLDALAAVVRAARRHDASPPWSMRWGLYQGRALGSAAEDAYLRELQSSVAVALAAQFRTQLDAYAGEPEVLYNYLRAYLMLGEPEHADGAFLADAAGVELLRLFGSQPDLRRSLEMHVAALFAPAQGLRRTTLDDAAVTQARAALSTATPAQLVYSRIRTQYLADPRALRLNTQVANLETVFARRSGGDWVVPALYTRAAFDEMTTLGPLQIAQDFAPEPWVMGVDKVGEADRLRWATQALGLYEQDYAAWWDQLLADVQVRMAGADVRQVLFLLGSPTSPLKGLLRALEENTNLTRPADALDKAGDDAGKALAQKAGSSAFGRVAAGLAQAQVGAAAGRPGDSVARHFEPINKLVQGTPGAEPIAPYLQRLSALYQQLAATGSGVGQGSALGAIGSGQGSVFQALQLEARQLPPPVDRWFVAASERSSAVAMSEAKGELGRKLDEQVGRDCRLLTAGRYPFDPGSTRDVPLEDFGRLFGYGGVFDSFFQQSLAPLVDTSAATWRWKDGAQSIGYSAGLLTRFQQAQQIRDTFFKPGSQLPEVRFTLSPETLDPAVNRVVLELTGQRYEYAFGPVQAWPASWPGQGPGQAVVSFQERSGGTPAQAFSGPWALFRLIEHGTLQAAGDDYQLALEAAGHSARFTLRPASIKNPFGRLAELRRFSCPG